MLLRLKGGRVEARYDFDEEDVEGQFVDALDLQRILDEWRRRIQATVATSASPLSETYRRNPAREHPL